jgi:hypothetical protein
MALRRAYPLVAKPTSQGSHPQPPLEPRARASSERLQRLPEPNRTARWRGAISLLEIATQCRGPRFGDRLLRARLAYKRPGSSCSGSPNGRPRAQIEAYVHLLMAMRKEFERALTNLGRFSAVLGAISDKRLTYAALAAAGRGPDRVGRKSVPAGLRISD